MVQNINLSGGSYLGVSRGGPNTSDIVDSIQVHLSLNWLCCFLLVLFQQYLRNVVLIWFLTIQAKRIDMLFILGGDGTHAGALAIHNEVFCNNLVNLTALNILIS